MSVTIAILIFFSALVVLPLSQLLLSSSSPQATRAPVPRASRATSIQRIKVCLTKRTLLRARNQLAGA